MANPLQPFKWLDAAHYVYNEYLSKPYTSKSIPTDWEFTHKDVTIPRPNHGLVHTLRTAAYVCLVVQAYNFFNQPPLTSIDTDHLQLALLFYVTGRENEASFGQDNYLKYRQKSVDAFEKYVRKNLPHQFTETQLQFYKKGIFDSYSSSPPHYVILRICHDLDLLRCYTRDEYLKKIQEASRYVGTLAEPLSQLAEECLRQTGDRIMGEQTYDGPLFTLCSTSVEATLQKLYIAFQLKQGVIMQAINPSAPIPPDLKAHVPKTPWNISLDLFARIQNQPQPQNQSKDAFKKCEVLSTDPEVAFVLQYFMHQKPHKYGISKIYCIHNPDQTSSFESGIKIIEREAENPIYISKGKEEEPKKERAKALQRWKECTASFSPFKIKGPRRTDKYTEVKVLPLWHGSSPEKCTSIFTSGFTSFGKHHLFNPAAQKGANASTDIGYFGSGIYFTDSPDYASMYSNGHLLLSWVSMREPYPVVNDVPHPGKGSDMKKLEGQGPYQNYNAHYIPVAPIKPKNQNCMEYYPCYQNQVPAWDEIVVFSKNQTLPRFWIELGLDSPEQPLFTAPVSDAKTDPVLKNKNDPVKPVTGQSLPEILPAVPVQAIIDPALSTCVFGAAEWKKYIGDPGVEPPLPPDIDQILTAQCPIWPDKKVHETHLLTLIPATVNGKPLTLKSLGELVQKPLQGKATGYFDCNPVLRNYVDMPATSHWVLMSRDVIPNSRKKSYKDQQTLAQGYTGYVIPNVLDATVAIFMEYVRSGTRLYNDNPWAFTRCQEECNKNWQLVVGGLSPDGLRVHFCYNFGLKRIGVGVARKFIYPSHMKN